MYDQEELVDIFDKKNRFLRRAKRGLVHKKGFYHRIVNIIVLNSNGEIFLQRRSKNKDICPLLWDMSAAEHLKSGEIYLQAAKRCLQEELGIITDNLVKIRGVHLQKNTYLKGKIKDYEFAELYKVVYNGKMRINKDEVEQGKFLKICFVDLNIKMDKTSFTPWFLDEWKYLYKFPPNRWNVV